MPWTDKPGGNGSNNNGSGNGNRGPWGQPPRGGGGNNGSGGGQQPDLEDLLKSGRERFRRTMGGGQGGGAGGKGLDGLPKGPAVFLIIGAFIILYALNAAYRVEPGEVSVVTTFGKYSGVETSGLRVHFPPIQAKEIVQVAQDRSIDVGVNSRTVDESSMLTSDLNIANVTLSVNWKIQEGVTEPGEMPGAAKYVFNIEPPQKELVKSIAEAAVREVVGSSEFDPLVTNGRAIVPEQMQVIMQEALDGYEAGIQILSVNFDKAEPPAEVIDTQLDVINARSEKAQKINVAQAYANREVPRARGEAQERIFQAEAYEARVVAEARGAASRFNDIYSEYAKAPEVTRQRMYLETVESVLGDMNKIVIDDQAGGTVPYLSLNELTRNRTTAN
ncbi:MAG: FtsH protease activity modulator HflK [Aquisalinus sp.]|nr:FtsH protease activity modulator HflK [Aquisalinus sp.]